MDREGKIRYIYSNKNYLFDYKYKIEPWFFENYEEFIYSDVEFEDLFTVDLNIRFFHILHKSMLRKFVNKCNKLYKKDGILETTENLTSVSDLIDNNIQRDINYVISNGFEDKIKFGPINKIPKSWYKYQNYIVVGISWKPLSIKEIDYWYDIIKRDKCLESIGV